MTALSLRTALQSFAVLLSCVVLGSCNDETTSTAVTTGSTARALSMDQGFLFQRSAWPQPSQMRLSRTQLKSGRCDTLILELEAMDAAHGRLASKIQGGAELGVQILDAEGGVLSQSGFEDTSAQEFRFAKPFREVPASIVVGPAQSPTQEQIDTIAFEVTSLGGRIRHAIAITRILAKQTSCPAHISGTCVEFIHRSAFVLDDKVSGYTISQVWNSTVGLLEYRTSSETATRLLP